MQPRIYTYKITFEEIPHWYWGVHKERRFGEAYMGSPVTHKWMWKFYTPKIQIVEFFPFTEEGWREANLIEDRLIRPDLNNPLCLNERCGGSHSLLSCKIGSQKAHSLKNQDGKSVHAIKIGKMSAKKVHEDKDKNGKSLHSLHAFANNHSKKDEKGRSVTAVKAAKAAHREKDEQGRSLHALKAFRDVHKEKDENGKSALSVRSGKAAHTEKDENGKSVHGVKSGKIGGKEAAKIVNAQKWEDPDHLELGQHSPGTLTQMQKRRGFPSGKENRLRVG